MKAAVEFCRSMAFFVLFLFNFTAATCKLKTVPNQYASHLWTTARCRATCLTAIQNETASEELCTKSASCSLCWDMCMRLEDNWNMYSMVCKHSDLCESGCQTACNVMLHPVKRFEIRGWRFESMPAIEVRKIEGRLRLSWSPPLAPTAEDVTRLVYAVFWQERNSDTIEPLIETANLFFESTNAHIVFNFDQVIIVAVSPNGPVAVVQQALYSKTKNTLNADTPTSGKLKSVASVQSLQTLLLILTLTFLSVIAFTLTAYICCLKERRGLQRANAIRRKTPNRVDLKVPASRKISLGRRVSPFAKEPFPVNVLSMSPMPDSKKNEVFVFDSSRLLTTRISSPL